MSILTWLERQPPTLRALTALLAVGLAGAPALAEDGAEGDREFREEVNVRLVELSAVFLDEDGAPVRDVQPGEVTIRAGGDDYEPSFMELAVQEPVDDAEDIDAEVMLGVPGGSGSLDSASAGDRRYYVVFVDVENDAPQTRGMASAQLADFIFESLGENDLVAVMSFDGEVNLELPFSSDHEAISSAISKAYQRERRAGISTEYRIDELLERLRDCGRGRDKNGKQIMDNFCVRRLLTSYMEELRPDLEEYFEALESLVRFAGSMQGQVTLLAVTHGKTTRPGEAFMAAVESVFRFSRQTTSLRSTVNSRQATLKRYKKRVVETALEEEVVLYVLDRTTRPSGLVSAEQGGARFQAGARPYREAYLSASNDMASLALETGGNMVRDTDLQSAAARAHQRERGRYVLGFYPSEVIDREELEDVRVEVDRDDIRVESSRAFYAGARSAWVLEGSVNVGQAEPTGQQGQKVRLPFTIETNPRGLAYERSDSATRPGEEVMRANLTAHVTLQTESGAVVAETFHTFTHEYDIPIWKAAREKPLMIPGQVVAPEGTYRLVAELRNYRVGQGGQLTEALELQAPN